MDAFRFYHENSKEYVLQDELLRNALSRSPRPDPGSDTRPDADRVPLPEGTPTDVSEQIRQRSSTHAFEREPIALESLATVLRDAYGPATVESSDRVVPSAGARYPLELYIVAFRVDGLEAGVHYYDPFADALALVSRGEYADRLATYSHDQDGARDAAAMILISARFERSTSVYGERGYRHALIEAGHIMQNAYLSCVAADIGICANGGFDDDQVGDLCDLDADEDAIYAAYLGRPAESQEETAE